jgi:hypothetical protein
MDWWLILPVWMDGLRIATSRSNDIQYLSMSIERISNCGRELGGFSLISLLSAFDGIDLNALHSYGH